MGPVRFAAYSLTGLRFFAIVVLASAFVLIAGESLVQAPPPKSRPPLLGRTILIDPGHGGIDPGCHLGSLTEKDLVLRVAVSLAQTLERLGAVPVLTRDRDTALNHLTEAERTRHRRDLAARVMLAGEHGAEIMISIHVNAAASASLGGAIVFYRPGSKEGRLLAERIYDRLKRVVPGNQNGTLPGNFYLLNHAPVPAVLVEVGFLTHPSDRQVLTSSDGPGRIAEAIARGVEAYMAGGKANQQSEGEEHPEKSAKTQQEKDLGVVTLPSRDPGPGDFEYHDCGR